MSILWPQSVMQAKPDTDDQGSKHAELMERRRALHQAEALVETSKQYLRRTSSRISVESADLHQRIIAPQPVIIAKVDPQLQLDLELVLSQISKLLQKVDSVSDKVATCLNDTAALRVLCQPKYDGPGPTLFLQSITLQVPDLADSGGDMLPGDGLTPGTFGIRPLQASSSGHSSAGSVGSVAGSLKSKAGKNGSDDKAKETEEEGKNGSDDKAKEAGEAGKNGSDDKAKEAGEEGKNGSDDKAKEAGEDGKNCPDENNAVEAREEEVDEKEEEESGDGTGRSNQCGVTWKKGYTGQSWTDKDKDSGLSMEYLRSKSSGWHREAAAALRRVRTRRPLSIKVWSFLEELTMLFRRASHDPDSMWGGRFTMNAISAMITVSAVIPVIQTMDPPPLHASVVTALEVVFDLIFALEVVVRFLTCPNRIAFCFNGCNLVDIAVGMLVLGLRCFSAFNFAQADSKSHSVLLLLLCAVPVMRLLKLLRRFEDFHLILKAFRQASEALPVLLFILSVIVLIFASLIYVLEPRSNIESLPKALWLTVVTVGTVGYGDVVPESAWGSLVTAALIVVSALYMAIPVGIVGKAFSDVWDDRNKLLMIHRARTRFLERGYKAQDIPAMFCRFDQDSSGELDLPEFIAMMHKMQVTLGTDRLVELFLSLDADGSGGIDDAEFVRTLYPSAHARIYGSKHPSDGTTASEGTTGE